MERAYLLEGADGPANLAMWFLGHMALGMAFGLAVLAFRRPRPTDLRVIVLFPFFGNLLDFFHLAPLRPFSHNWIGAFVLPLIAILVWNVWTKWSKWEAVALLAASMGEPLGDLTFGSFYPYAPVSWQPAGLNFFNTPQELVTDVFLGIGLILALVLLFRNLGGPKALLGFRGPWIISPAMAVFLMSVLGGGEIVLFMLTDLGRRSGALQRVVLLEMIIATLLYALLWVVALVLSRTRQGDAQASTRLA